MAIEIRKGSGAELEAYIRLLQRVHQAMCEPDWFYLDSPEDMRAMMDDGVMDLWLAMDNGRLAAGFNSLIPGLDDYNYGYDLGFSQEQLLRVINMDTVAVDAAYRGQGLQNALIQTAEGYFQDLGERILLCTVHPDNRYSLSNFLAQGYTIVKRVPKYGSERFVLRKDLR